MFFFKSKMYCNINQKLAKQFILHSAEAYSEPFQTLEVTFSNVVDNSLEVTIFEKTPS